MEKLKPWLYIILPNILFFAFFSGAIIVEAATHINTNETGDVFLYLLPIYIVFYSFFTYKNIRKIFMPTLFFGITLFAFLFITDYFTAAFSGFYSYSNDIILGILLIFLIFTIVPTIVLLIVQLIIKYLFKKLNK